MKSTSSTFRPVPAFTLAELLLVISVIGILAVLTGPSLFSTSAGVRLTSTGDLLLNKLTEVQQRALASNAEVEVRFLEQQSSGQLSDRPRLGGFQVLTIGASSATGEAAEPVAAEPVTWFEEGVVISAKPKLSSLVEAGYKDDTSSDGAPARYLALRIQPDGSVNLPGGKPWFLTLVGTDSESREEVPLNFYTIQVEPATGRLRRFRP